MIGPALKRVLKAKRPSFGSWITLGHPSVAEIMAQAGFEWLTIDLEHSVIGLEMTQALIQAISLSGCTPLVRLTTNDPAQAKRVMDAGAAGVIVPMVNSASEAEAAVQSVHYPPRGHRGVGLARAQGYGASFVPYLRSLKDSGVVIVQIEHRRAVENIESILKVPGVDGVFMGPYDISASYGVHGQFNHPLMRQAQRRVLQACANAGICAGIHVVWPSVPEARRRLAQGFRFIAFSTDILFLGDSCRGSASQLKNLKQPARRDKTR